MQVSLLMNLFEPANIVTAGSRFCTTFSTSNYVDKSTSLNGLLVKMDLHIIPASNVRIYFFTLLKFLDRDLFPSPFPLQSTPSTISMYRMYSPFYKTLPKSGL